ncbi:MAG: mechanosensitive ion channel family protein [Treponema sp.]|nr:mechanosensitive ion channel family protein [Treponema sp.]
MNKYLPYFFLIVFCLLPWNSPAQENNGAPDQAQTESAQTQSIQAQSVQAQSVQTQSAVPADVPGVSQPAPTAGDNYYPEDVRLKNLNEQIQAKVYEPRLRTYAQRLIIALLVIVVQAFLIWLIWFLFKKLAVKITNSDTTKIKPLTFRKFKLLSAKQIKGVILFSLRILKYLITIFQLVITVPIVFSLFPETRYIATIIFGYIVNPLKNILIGFVKYIPNLITIIIIIVIVRYLLKGLKFLANQIAKGRLVLPGFYADWALPTYKILQVLLIAFTIAVVYPYLPDSDSKIFQGVSVFIGIVFSLGSTSAIGNLVAGFVITYMRPFKIGDRVQIKETTGFVVEKNLMVVRLKTHKNEYVTFPNQLILGSNIINYNTSSDEDEEGLILNTDVTFGYSIPCETVHEILINAALATEYVLKRPAPFVLQISQDDFYARYQINCYTKHVDIVPKIYTQLRENIQKAVSDAGLDLTTPHYLVITEKPKKG